MNKKRTDNGYILGRVIVEETATTDTYSDGDIENVLLEIVKTDKKNEILKATTNWPVFYHLSPRRENILNWYPFEQDAEVLEIGMGCGAITGALCRSCGTVTGVELSARRAEIAAWRHCHEDNLRIHVGNINDLNTDKKYDYITLIGVLEYAGTFTHTINPYADFLGKCRSLLKKDGVLLLAIENRYGLKYWSGAREDHTGKIFDGIINYDNDNRVRTFSKPELNALLKESGFSELEWYYPFPDYKFPDAIFSDDRLPTKQDVPEELFEYYDCDRYVLFDEKKAMDGILDSSLYDIFSNSFLVACHNGGVVK